MENMNTPQLLTDASNVLQKIQTVRQDLEAKLNDNSKSKSFQIEELIPQSEKRELQLLIDAVNAYCDLMGC